ncbi:MAG: phosphatidate cytidylyltransferase [Woeseiaceae bacterium]|nr:phosphatidate cytidylyltransferase [Woeseiaceae bacterium]
MLKQRIITGLIALGILLFVLFVLPANAAKASIGLLILGGAWEWTSFLKSDSPVARGLFMLVITGCILAVGAAPASVTHAVLLAALGWWLAALGWTFFFPTSIPGALRWLCGVAVLVPLFVALVELYASGPQYLLCALFVVWAADVGAFFFGKQFGRVKLAPAISPGKTWEGVVGGLFVVGIVAAVFAMILDVPAAVLVPFSLAAAALSIVGDLTVSMFKRTAGVKDSGALFPGHGGVLDRIDSVAAAAPLFVLGLGWLGITA